MNLTTKNLIKKIIFFTFFLLSASCKAGLFVTKASGTISLSNTELSKENNVLVLVFAYQHTGLKLNSDEYLFQKKAFLVYPDSEGKYSFSPAKKGEKFEVYFFARLILNQSTSICTKIHLKFFSLFCRRKRIFSLTIGIDQESFFLEKIFIRVKF